MEDFDIAFASVDGLSREDEIDGSKYAFETDWRGSEASNKTNEYYTIHRPNQIAVSDDEWKNCNGKSRNLYITITRVKDSDPQNKAMRQKRNLQFYPNGTKFADIDILFSNYRGVPNPKITISDLKFSDGPQGKSFSMPEF